jgi:hypothetical protein
MLPREFFKNSSHGEFSSIVLSNKVKVFVSTYINYILNSSRAHLSNTKVSLSTCVLSSSIQPDEDPDDRQTALFILN